MPKVPPPPPPPSPPSATPNLNPHHPYPIHTPSHPNPKHVVNLPKAYTTGEGDVSEADVTAAQKLWAESIASISKVHPYYFNPNPTALTKRSRFSLHLQGDQIPTLTPP